MGEFYIRLKSHLEVKSRSIPMASEKAETKPVTSETAPSFAKKEGVWGSEKGNDGGRSPSGARIVQNPNAMSAPVAAAARNPASDLRRANGSGT